MDKFERNYKLTVQVTDSGDLVEIKYPLTIEFDVRRENLSCAGRANMRIYNLQETNRAKIYKSPNDPEVIRTVKLEAGYGDSPLSTIFDGNIREAKSFRPEGQVNFITEIGAFDYAFAMSQSQSNWTASEPYNSYDSVIRRLCDDLKRFNVKTGVIGKFDGIYARNPAFNDNTWDLLQKVVASANKDATCYIDSGRVFVLNVNDVFEGPVPVINSDTGLLGAPKQNGQWIIFETIFEPRLLVGQRIQLDSRSQKKFNGLYKVIGIEHVGTISGAVCGKCKTIVTLMLGSQGSNDPFNVMTISQ